MIIRLITSFFFSAVIVLFLQCGLPGDVDKGVICIQDSLGCPGDSSRNVYVYYRDFGLMGRGLSTYVAVEKESRFLNENHWFYSDLGIMKIKAEGDSLYIFTSTRAPDYVESLEIKYRVIVDTQTWKYPHPYCVPVKP